MGFVPFLLGSKPQKRPMSLRESSNILSYWEHSQCNFICFLVLSNQCHCTLTRRWSFLWIALVHTFIQSSSFWISSRIPKVVNPGKIVHSNSVDPIQLFGITFFQKPIRPIVLCFDHFSADISQTVRYTFIQPKHFRPKTLSSKTISSKTEDNFIHDTFIQKRFHPMTLHPKTISSRPWTLNPEPWTPNTWTLNPEP